MRPAIAPASIPGLRALWNAALTGARLAGWSGSLLDVDVLLARAARATGLTDFGDAGFREPLDLLVDGLVATAGTDASGAADLIIASMERAIQSKKVTYDFARLMEGATQVSCSGFGQVMIDHM